MEARRGTAAYREVLRGEAASRTAPLPAAAAAAEDAPNPPGGLTRRQITGLVLAPLAFAWFMLGWAPAGTTPPMRWAMALTAAMAVLWICESVPLAVTALLPLVVLPLGGVSTAGQAGSAYAADLVFIFIGGFVLANGVQHSGLHYRVALGIVRVTGTRRAAVVAALMALTAFVSLWISNTAAAVLMMPVGLAVWHALCPGGEEPDFAGATVLGIAAGASIGGMGTPFGSTPNLIFTAMAPELYDIRVTFAAWATLGLPLVVAFTAVAWWLLTRLIYPLHGRARRDAGDERAAGNERAAVVDAQRKLGPLRLVEVLAGAVFCATALAWVLRGPWVIGGRPYGLSVALPRVTDGTIAIAGAVAMFLVPVSLRPWRFALDWNTGGRMPWNVILLIGGGLSLAEGIQRSGFDRMMVDATAHLAGMPPWVALLALCALTVALSEIASNTATAALLLPLAGAMAAGLGQPPIYLMLPIAFAASLGLMLPAATPPNALAIASGHVSVTKMAFAGLLLNVIGLALIVGGCYALGFRAFAAASP
jgi:sodium-dependent dicarboxylate transporter 2/3/5